MPLKYSDIVRVNHAFHPEPHVVVTLCRYWTASGGFWTLDEMIPLHCERAVSPHDPLDLSRMQEDTILDLAAAIPREEGSDPQILSGEGFDPMEPPPPEEEPDWGPDPDRWYEDRQDREREDARARESDERPWEDD